MGQVVFILGKPGTGKSYSLRNFDPQSVGVINVQGKILPFKGGASWDITSTDDSDEITAAVKKLARKYKRIIIDDYQYVMANEFMRRSTEKGYDKFTDIGRHAWDIVNEVRNLDPDVLVYILCHTDTDQDGFEKLKTIGKLLDEKIYLEGMSTIVLKTHVEDGKYTFLTQNNGKDTVKSPAGMFPSYAIENDLAYVDDKIRSYFEIGDHKSDEEMAEADAAVAHEEIQKEEPKKKRSRAKEEPADEYAGAKEPFEKARRKMAEKPAPGSRSRRISQTLKEEREQVMEENLETLLNMPESEDTEVPFTEEGPELKPLPRRKSRVKAEAETAPEPAAEEAPAVRRRGRRRTV